ncbi:DUF3135 domain-containing protein [Aromatoleum bremense]|uniref:DUF3135 domain-containing protein n=1 Tax=Aromatoleum bremense TaxID=76115 RepID=A0ABX1NR12_9RHOO|nr:DUF3135 domain-containing protein [Aromatoleum bremense]NMG14429.1 DUF3135 domain-containing protein [Aromatoleum bremense]QTQ30761.1 putative protein DUf3135 [Aromatoleum bremense]
MAGFDFGYWSSLAQRDPEAFFRARSEVIEQFIAAHPAAERGRLRELQRRIDCIRASAGGPLRATGVLCAMMRERLELLQLQCERLRALGEIPKAVRPDGWANGRGPKLRQ